MMIDSFSSYDEVNYFAFVEDFARCHDVTILVMLPGVAVAVTMKIALTNVKNTTRYRQPDAWTPTKRAVGAMLSMVTQKSNRINSNSN